MSAIPQHLQSALAERYTLDRELGRGGMATVFLAQDSKHDRVVALKVLHPELADPHQQTGHAERQPGHAHVVNEAARIAGRLDHPAQRWREPQQHGNHHPGGHQHDLAPDVVADLDVFLVLVGRLVHVVVAARLEEEVARLTRGHRDAPGNDRRQRGIDEQQAVGDDEADRADQMQALVDPAVVVVAVVVPALRLEKFEEVLHGAPWVARRVDAAA